MPIEHGSDSPAVSVVIAVYNDATRLPRAVESISKQTFQDWELLIVDDGSTDQSGRVATSLASRDPRIRVLSTPNGGPARARNVGIRAARGEWIAILDSDDYSAPNRLERQLRFAAEHPEVGCIGSWANRVSTRGRYLGVWRSGYTSVEQFREARRRDTVMHIVHPSAMIRRVLLLQVGGYPEDYPLGEDVALYNLRLAPLTDIVVIPEVLVTCETNPDSITRRLVREVDDLDVTRLNIKRRRAGLPELGWAEAVQALTRDLPLLGRVMLRRHMLAQQWFAQGVAMTLDRRPIGGARLVGAFVLAPAYFARRTFQLLRRFLSRTSLAHGRSRAKQR